jgi:hypothetical protein
MTMKTLLSLGIIAIAAISVSSCESEKSKIAKVAKMEQISFYGKNYGLELLPGSLYLHPEGSNGEKGHWFEHRGGPGSPIYVSYSDWVARAMLPPESFENEKEKKRLVFNLDLKKIIFTTGPGQIRVFPTEELLVPGGKMYGVIISRYHEFLTRGFGYTRVYTLDGVLRYDNKGGWPDVVIEGRYIYDSNSSSPSDKAIKIHPDGRRENPPYFGWGK